jgi:hypothetical protein
MLEARLFSSLQVIPWDTVENIKMNNAFLVKAENTWTLIRILHQSSFL